MKTCSLTLIIAVFLLFGVGVTKAQTIQTELNQIELIKQFIGTWKCKMSENATFVMEDAFDIFKEHWDLDSIEYIEEFKLMLLTRSNKVLGIASISKGGISGTVTDVRVILQYAIKANASGIIICHNHPSGNLQPSETDQALTRKIKDSGLLMDVQLLDHLIITAEDDYYSFADNGLI